MMTSKTKSTEDLEKRLQDIPPLSRGAHTSLGSGACVMEAVAYVAGEPWSDRPACVSPSIAAFLRCWNDELPAADRERLLRPLVLEVIDTKRSEEVEQRRAWAFLDWLTREHVPSWMDLTEQLRPHAGALRRLPKIDSLKALRAAAAYAARVAAWAAAAYAAGGAAGAAGRDAAWAAAAYAAGGAAGDAARVAAWDAAWDAARDAAGAAGRDAAGAAAWVAAGDAAGGAAWDAAWGAAGDAAWDAAGDVLRPTVRKLQESAVTLVRQMIALEAGR